MTGERQLYEGCRRYETLVQKRTYDTYSALMRGICYRYARNSEEIGDMLQEGFVKIFINIRKFEWKGEGSFQSWMKTVMINTAITYYHKYKKHSKEISYHAAEMEADKNEMLNQANTETDPSADELYDGRRFSVEEIMFALKQIPEEFSIVFNLYAIEGYSHKEIGNLLRIKDETSRTRFLRAKKLLRIQLLDIEKQSAQRTE